MWAPWLILRLRPNEGLTTWGGAVLQRKQLLIVSFPRNSGVYFYTNPCPHLPLAPEGRREGAGNNREWSGLLAPRRVGQASCQGLHVLGSVSASKQPCEAQMRLQEVLRSLSGLSGEARLREPCSSPLLCAPRPSPSHSLTRETLRTCETP